MTNAEAWDLQRIDRPTYELSEQRPLRVAAKYHPRAGAERLDMHYALELGILLDGRMDRLYQGYRRNLLPGDVWLCGSWEPHGFQVTSGPCDAVVVSIFPPMLTTTSFPELGSIDWLSPFILEASQRPAVPSQERSAVKVLAEELVESLRLPDPRRFIVQRMLVYQTLLVLPRATAPQPRAEPLDAQARINRAIEYVFKHRRYVSSAEVARHCALSPKTFHRLFSRALGISFRTFALRYRLQGAATQLLESRDPIKAIANEWGFVDASHFHVSFQSVYGCSPAHYRSALPVALEQGAAGRVSHV
jgi:AraC-like DNA-binding protein